MNAQEFLLTLQEALAHDKRWDAIEWADIGSTSITVYPFDGKPILLEVSVHPPTP